MTGLVRLFLVEEIRLRRSFSTALSLLIFPEVILLGALAGYVFFPLLTETLAPAQIHLGIISGLTFFGISMGGIAFLGKEFLERSLGPVNMLAASSQYHPVSERRMFFSYFLHDLLFYVFLVLLPMTIGFALGTIVRPLVLSRFMLVTASQWTAFLFGLSLSLFVSSTLSSRSKMKWFLVPISLLPLVALQVITGNVSSFLPMLVAVEESSWSWVVIGLLFSFSFILMGIFFYDGGVGAVQQSNTGNYHRTWSRLSRLFSDPTFVSLLSRDVMNILRGRAYIRLLFSLLFPLLVMAGMVGFIGGYDSNTIDFNVPFFAVMVSFFTMSIYTNLVNMDFLEFDQTLPVRTTDLINVKLVEYMGISIPISILFLGVVGWMNGDLKEFLFSIPLVLVMVPYMGHVTAYLTGLWTNSMLFDSSVFLRYMVLAVMPLMMATLFSFLMDRIFLISLVGLSLITIAGMISTLFLRRSIESKWADSILSSAGDGSE